MFTPEEIISIASKKEFHKKAMKLYRYQYEHNLVYHEYCNLIKKTPNEVKTLEALPYLPIEFFKTKDIRSTAASIAKTFTSSGTTGMTTSSHYLSDLSYYQQSFLSAFTSFYGSPENYVILALLPAYLEREGSSLIYMVDDLIKRTNHPKSGFYLHNLDQLAEELVALDQSGERQVLLIGVSFALLDLVEKHSFELKNTIVMETGGMKGRRKEMIRAELHEKLTKGFGVQTIHSEYGMTELLSQAYSFGEGVFECPPWMQVSIRDTEDPFTLVDEGKTGAINIIDLANVESCAFIATQDLGKKHSANTFEVLGRFDHSDIRGCNLLVATNDWV